jgi:DNA-binding transcriptional LysR family regulator
LSLFERNHSGITLTKGGEIMRDCFDRYAQDIEQARMLALRAEESECLRVGLLMGMDFRRALEYLHLFRLEHPSVDLYSASSDELKEDLLTGRSNAALLFDNHLKNLKGFEHVPLYPSRFVYVLSHLHPLAGRESLTAKDIADYEFIFSTSGKIEGQGIFGHIAGIAQALEIREEQVRFCRNFESIFVEVAAGQGMTLMDEHVSFLNEQYATIPTGLAHSVVAAWKTGTGTPPLDRLITCLKRELS